MFGALRSRLGVFGIITLVLIVIIIVAIAGYGIYHTTLAATPEKAIATYLDTLNKGDLARLYTLTFGASSQSQAEFATQVGALVKDNRLTADGTTVEPVGRQRNLFYFSVTAKLTTPDGSYRPVSLLLQAAQEGNAWHVALFFPPAAVPSGQ